MMKTGLVLALGLVACPAVTVLASDPSPVQAHQLQVASDVLHAVRRALPNAPNGYTPTNVTCPSSRPSVRSAATLSDNETDWLETRRKYTIDPMTDFLERMNISDFNASDWINNHSSNVSALPNIGIAFSGGGYRAMLNGAGALKAWDSRTNNATADGQFGGLLQSATYVAGLSGGSWLVGSIYMNNFSSVGEMQNDPSKTVWRFENSIFVGPEPDDEFSVLGTASYYDDLHDEVKTKSGAGYTTSITDYWGRALSYQLINATSGGISYTWSSIAQTQDFIDGKYPMPFIVADNREPNELLVSLNTTVFEFNPFELGSYDPTLYGFIPVEYVGSAFEDGELPDNASCVRGFDAASYVMGTSSSLFNEFLLEINSTSLPSWLQTIFTDLLTDLGEANEDIAEWYPNPFYQYNEGVNPTAANTTLTLVDGGEDGQNVPLHPLIQPLREVDVIFAIDSSADTDYYWPNGTSLVATYERSLNTSGIANGTSFPSIPDQNTFINLGLNNRPTFFGCNSSNTSTTTPIVVYLANAPYVYHSNFSTFTADYTIEQRDDVILNGYNVATMGNATRDSDWPACVACVILSRSFERTNTTVPDVCNTCFENYCWNGTTNSTLPENYNPDYILQELNTTSAAAPSFSGLALGGSRTAAVWAVFGTVAWLLM